MSEMSLRSSHRSSRIQGGDEEIQEAEDDEDEESLESSHLVSDVSTERLDESIFNRSPGFASQSVWESQMRLDEADKAFLDII